MTNKEIKPPFYLVSGSIYADPEGKLCLIKVDRDNDLSPVERDELLKFVLEACNNYFELISFCNGMRERDGD